MTVYELSSQGSIRKSMAEFETIVDGGNFDEAELRRFREGVRYE